MNVEITDARPEDARGIVQVLYRTWLATYPNEEIGVTVEDVEESYKDSFAEENLNKLSAKIVNIPPNERRLVARIGNEVIGVSTIIRNETNNQLRTIYVLPEYQGKGIGKMLWQKALEFCDSSKDTIVQVATYNQNAIEFYRKLGFVDNGRRFTDEIGRMKKSGVAIPEMEMVIKANTA